MNGAEHYIEAERLLGKAEDGPNADYHLAAAQVHATLALAAATVWTVEDPASRALGTRSPDARVVGYGKAAS